MAETTPLVSVVLTTFNRSRLLSRSIDSVLAQTFTDFQLIVVDDCSTDDTQQVLAGIDDTRLSVIRHERNRGLSEARNSGVRAAAGTFVAFHDDDDEWLPQKLAVEVAALSGQPDPGHVCLYSQVLVDDGISADVRNTSLVKLSFALGSDHLEALLPCGEVEERAHATSAGSSVCAIIPHHFCRDGTV